VGKLTRDTDRSFEALKQSESFDFKTSLPASGALEHISQTNRLRGELANLNFGEKGDRLSYLRSHHIKPMIDAVELFGQKGFDLSEASAGTIAGVQRLLRENGYSASYNGVADKKTLEALRSATGTTRVTTESLLRLVDKYEWDRVPRAFGWDGVPAGGMPVKVQRSFNLDASFAAHFDGQKMNTVERELFKKLPTKEAQQRVLEQYSELSVSGRNSHMLGILVDSEKK
jgi:hypothetical protein